MPLDHLQQLRDDGGPGDQHPDQAQGLPTSADKCQGALRELLRAPSRCQVETWEEKQGPLLAAISIEKGILNVLLFMIIAVAGFGILAIF